MNAKFIFLGSGGSMGVPVIGCDCAVCCSKAKKNKRSRAAGLLQVGKKNYLIDVGPEFRLQALQFGLKHLSGVILTHTHYDHIAAIDDLRIFYFRQQEPVPCLLSQETFDELKVRYHYLVRTGDKFNFQIMPGDSGKITFEGLDVNYMSYIQVGMRVTGLRFGSFAYITDIKEYSDEIISHLSGIDTLVVSALRHSDSAWHLTVEEAVLFAKKVGAKQTFFTHISHDLDHETTNRALPEGISLGYDGLELKCEV